MNKVLDVFISGELPGLNKVIGANRANKHVGAKLKRETEEMLLIALRAQGCAFVEDGPLIWTFIWQCKNRRRDPDNIASATKFIFDALQSGAFLANDGWRQVAEIHHYFEVNKTVGVRVMAHRRGRGQASDDAVF